MRLLRRMEAGVIRSLEVEDASPTSTALMTLQHWMERIAEKEVERITAQCRRYLEQGKQVPAWVRAGMDERFLGRRIDGAGQAWLAQHISKDALRVCAGYRSYKLNIVGLGDTASQG